MDVEFMGVNCEVLLTKYLNGQPAIILYDDEGEEFAVASVAMQHMPPEGCVWVKNYSENDGMTAALVKAGVIAPEIMGSIQSGFVTVHAYRLLLDA